MPNFNAKSIKEAHRLFFYAFNLLIGFCVINFVLTGCSTDIIGSSHIQSDDIYQNYVVKYDATISNLELDATFRVGGPTGTTIRLESPSELHFNGEGVPPKSGMWDNLFGQHYISTQQISTSNPVDIDWISPNQIKYHNRVHIPSLRSPNPLPLTFSRNLDILIDVEAPDWNQSTDKVTLVLTQTGPQSTQQIDGAVTQGSGNLSLPLQKQPMFVLTSLGHYDTSTHKFTIDHNELAGLYQGPASISLQRSRSLQLSQASRMGGYVTLIHIAAKAEILLE